VTDGEPERLRVVGATDLEQRLLAAAAGEAPSPELKRRMARAVGVAAGLATAAAPTSAVATGKAAGASLTWPLVSAGVLALAAAGAVVGWSRPHRPVPPPAAVAAVVAAPTPVEAPAPAATPARPHRHTAPAARTGDLRAEIALLDAARAAAASGDGVRTLALLRRYDASFPAGTFRPESAALQVEALARLGQTERARALGRAFIAAHPDSPLVARVRRATAAP